MPRFVFLGQLQVVLGPVVVQHCCRCVELGDRILQWSKQIVQRQGRILITQEQLPQRHRRFLTGVQRRAEVILIFRTGWDARRRRGENGAYRHRAAQLGVAVGRGGGGEAVAERRQRQVPARGGRGHHDPRGQAGGALGAAVVVGEAGGARGRDGRRRGAARRRLAVVLHEGCRPLDALLPAVRHRRRRVARRDGGAEEEERGAGRPRTVCLVERAPRRRALPGLPFRGRGACHGRYFVTNPARVFRQRGWGRARRELPIPRRGVITREELCSGRMGPSLPPCDLN
jgi:hypothetical protein